jgi:hypothetical protein
MSSNDHSSLGSNATASDAQGAVAMLPSTSVTVAVTLGEEPPKKKVYGEANARYRLRNIPQFP